MGGASVPALRGAGLLKADPDAGAEARLDILLPNFSTAIVGLSLAGNRARWLGGAPRLRLPAGRAKPVGTEAGGGLEGVFARGTRAGLSWRRQEGG